MNNDYCSNTLTTAEGNTEGTVETGRTKVLGKVQNCAKQMFMNPMFITFIILIIFVAFIIFWYYVRLNWYKKFLKNYYNFKGLVILI